MNPRPVLVPRLELDWRPVLNWRPVLDGRVVVIPAQAGIQVNGAPDPGLRGIDGGVT